MLFMSLIQEHLKMMYGVVFIVNQVSSGIIDQIK